MTSVWLNGELKSTEQPLIAASDRGFLLGDGLFETLRADHGRIRKGEEHLSRLRDGLERLSIPFEACNGQLFDAMAAVIRDNGLDHSVAALRLTVTRGVGPRGLLPPKDCATTVMITAAPYPEPTTPLRLMVVEGIRRNEHSPSSRLKALNYLDNILALKIAQEALFDDAVLLNTAGRIACATTANIFVLREGQLLTPDLGEGCLPGTTRKLVMALAHQEGLAVKETQLQRTDLRRAEGLFLTNSLMGIRPVTSLDDHSIGTAEADKVIDRLKQRWYRQGF